MPRVKFAIIGTGLIGPRHAAAVQGDPDAILTCIVDPNPLAKSVALKIHVPIHATVQDMLRSVDKPDAAIVCTPNHTHVGVSTELLEGGVHVLVEKPISTDQASGKILVELARSKNLKVLVGHHRRFNKYILTAKSILDGPLSLGPPLAINGMWTLYKPPEYFQPPAEWRRNPDSGGPILINLIHEIDLLHYLLGPIERVKAERGYGTDEVRGPEHKTESCVAITFRFASGAVGTFLLADNMPSPFNFESGTGENPTIPFSGMDFYRVFCTNGVFSVPDMTVWRYKTEDGANKSWTEELARDKVEVVAAKTPFELQVAHFIRVIRNEEEPSCSGEDGLRALVVCQAVKEAMETNRAVDIKI